MRPETVSWWRQAQADLETGRQILALSRYYAASWFAQQAVEKKALYIELQGQLAPRPHDLEFLARHVGVPSRIASDVQELNPAFDIVRYPDPVSERAPIDVVTPALATNHLDVATRVLSWIEQPFTLTSNQHS